MNQERRALVAFAVLGALVVGPVAATAGHRTEGTGVARAAGSAVQGRAADEQAGRGGGSERAGSTEGGGKARHSRFPTKKGPTPLVSVCGVSVPRYPGARPSGGRGDERTILRAVKRLGLTDPLTQTRTFRIPGDAWVGKYLRTPEDVFQFYQRRMREIPVFRMGKGLRSLLGLRPVGEVDSPPLLYVDAGSIVLVRPQESGMGLLVGAACSSTV